MSNTKILEEEVMKYILDSYTRITAIPLIVNTWYRDLIESVMENMCPFCRKRFSSRRSLRTHMLRNFRCREMLGEVVGMIIRDYRRIKRSVGKGGGGCSYAVHVNGRKKYFRTFFTALDFAVQHLPELDESG